MRTGPPAKIPVKLCLDQYNFQCLFRNIYKKNNLFHFEDYGYNNKKTQIFIGLIIINNKKKTLV